MYRTYVVSSDINKYVPLFFNMDGLGEWEDAEITDEVNWHEKFTRRDALTPLPYLPFYGDLKAIGSPTWEQKIINKMLGDIAGYNRGLAQDENSYWYKYLRPAGIPYSNFTNSLSRTYGDMRNKNRWWWTILALYTMFNTQEEAIYKEMAAWDSNAPYPPSKRSEILNNGYYFTDACIRVIIGQFTAFVEKLPPIDTITIEYEEIIDSYKVRQHRDTLYAKTVKGQNKVFNTFYPGIPDWFVDKNVVEYRIPLIVEVKTNGRWWNYSSSEGIYDCGAWEYYMAHVDIVIDMRTGKARLENLVKEREIKNHGTLNDSAIPRRFKVC